MSTRLVPIEQPDGTRLLRSVRDFRCPHCNAPHLRELPPLLEVSALSPLILLLIGGISGALLVAGIWFALEWTWFQI